ncbi:hypothetical protein Tco_0077940 [Tanacetum coccineum]
MVLFKAKTINGEVQLHALVDGKKIIITESTVRRDLQLEDAEGVDCLPNSTIFEQLTLMGEAGHKELGVVWWRSQVPRNHGDTIAQTRFKNVSKHLVIHCSQEFEKNARVESSGDEESLGEDTSKQGRINAIDEVFVAGQNENVVEEVVDAAQVSTAATIVTITIKEITLAQALEALKTSKTKLKRIVFQEPGKSTMIAVHKKLGDSLVRAATTASSLEAEQDNGNINKTQSKATPNESSSQGTNSGGGLKCQETMGDTIAQTRFENVSKHSNDSLLARDNEIASLKRRVKKLEKKDRSRTHKLKRLYKVGLTARVESSDDKESLGEDASKQGRIDSIDADAEITLVSVYDMNVSAGEEVIEVINTAKLIINAAQVSAVGDKVSSASATTTVSAATTTTATTVDDITLAQALEEMKSTKPKKKEVVIQELGESTTTISSQLSSQQSHDKGKGILIEPEKPLKKKYQISFDEETALKLQDEFDEEERLAREKAEKEQEANIALIETWDDIQAKIDADHQLAERLQAQEQEELSIEERATLFQQLLEKRRKNFAAKRAEEKRNKPPTKAQQRKIMVNTFEDFRTELVEDKEKIAGAELVQESTKKQKVENDKEPTEIEKLMEIIPDEEELAIDAIPLAVKSPSIVDWNNHKEGNFIQAGKS